MNADQDFTGYRVEVVSVGDQRVIGAYVNDRLVVGAWEPNLPTGMWRLTMPGTDLPTLHARDKEEAVQWVSYLASRRAA